MSSSSDLVEVRILGVPVVVHAQTAEHHDELLREFQLLLASAATDDNGSRPARVIALAASLRHQFGTLSAAQAEELDAARDAGVATTDLVYRLPAAAAPAAARYNELLDEADEYCRQGRLMTMAAPVVVLAYRRWLLNEFVAQIGGHAPTPWPESESAARPS